MLAGGGVVRSGGQAALAELAERLRAPVVSRSMSRTISGASCSKSVMCRVGPTSS
ncbi:hypothetical protein AB0I53_18715 [Saccharopolyspora sp. NPDC050389]|uniref:hypothetical protein n=1 Tax=Saccharopolyspora sp. NPDC050389 TaxID=3155516 RepID=UPI0033E36CE8